MPTRRYVLAAVGLATTSAGCVGVLGSEDEGSPDGSEGSPDGAVRLGELHVQNNSDESLAVQLAIDTGGDVVHLETYELDAGTTTERIDGPWVDEPGHYRIHASLDDGEIETEAVTDGVAADTECVRALVRVDGSGRLGVWTGAGCDDTSGF